MNVIDIAILILLAFGALVGFKRGFTKELVSFVGFILVAILSFALKDTVSVWLYQVMPFFNFGGIFKGVTALNIIVYEVIAFLVVFAILMIIFKLVLFATGIIEKIFDLTIVLGIFSKFLGAIVGVVEYFVIIFIVLYVASLPFFNFDILNESKLRGPILNNTPILSGMVDKSIQVLNEFAELKDKYETSGSANEFNREALDLFLEYKIISVENVELLVEKDKLSIDRIDELLDKYREE